MLSVPKFCLGLRRKLIHRWIAGEALRFGLNYRPDKSSWALLFPIWFPFYGLYSHISGDPSDRSPSVALVLPVFAVGWFRFGYELPKYDHFYWNWWRWPLVRKPFGMRARDAFLVLDDVPNFSGVLDLRKVTYALWSLRRQGWSVDKIMERMNG